MIFNHAKVSGVLCFDYCRGHSSQLIHCVFIQSPRQQARRRLHPQPLEKKNVREYLTSNMLLLAIFASLTGVWFFVAGGPGRPKSEATVKKAEDKLIVDSYPTVNGHDQIAFEAKDECKNCRLWKGRIALKPCGHGKYCFSCMEKFKVDASVMNRPGKCLSDNCYEVIKGWFLLYNVSP